MKVLAIVGSNRRGNTYSMVEAACSELEDVDVELIHLYGLRTTMCDGCMTCGDTGECHIQDPMRDLIDTVRKADGFIFGTPARFSLLSGELKVFFDRLNPLWEQLSGKKAVIFAVGFSEGAEGEEAKSIKSAAKSVKYFCDDTGIEVVDTVLAEGCDQPTDIMKKHPEILDKCKKSAIRLAKALHKQNELSDNRPK